MADLDFIQALEQIILQRLEQNPEDSYTARIAQQGVAKVAQKVGEEGVELALAAVVDSDARVKEEAADLLFHALLLLALRGIPFQEVVTELEQRHRQCGGTQAGNES